jgi:alkylation response protein AidB-like acyl-CoA dehydrogenase
MERLPFTEEQNMFREAAREFFKREIKPHTERWREAGIVDREAFLKAGEAGLLLIWADEKYGGQGLSDFRYEQILIEENAWHGDPCFFSTLHSRLVAPYIGNFGTEEQKARFLPKFATGESILAIAMTEPDAGSDLAGMKSTATRDGDDWILSGQKTYISNGILSDVVIVAAKTDPNATHAMGLFLVERGMPGFERGRNLEKMGMKAQDTAELFFENVRIPAENVLGPPEGGFFMLMQGLAEERLIAAVGNVVGCQMAMHVTKDFVQQRKVFGKPLSKFQNTRFKLKSTSRRPTSIAPCRCTTKASSRARTPRASSSIRASSPAAPLTSACSSTAAPVTWTSIRSAACTRTSASTASSQARARS